jgi:hypothetical protein
MYDFNRGELWRDLFDRVLWVPLRNLNLAETSLVPDYSYFNLFRDEYFFGHPERDSLAAALCRELEDSKSRTLFILDGLDELSHGPDGSMSPFLRGLLNRPNIIITSQPRAMLPAGVQPPDIEVEIIGFRPRQVNNYLQKMFEEEPQRAGEVESLLAKHPIIQNLARIPVVLDALCCTWDADVYLDTMPDSISQAYIAIEQTLWKQDLSRSRVGLETGPKIEPRAPELSPCEPEQRIANGRSLLEALAFIGLYSNVIYFEPKHLLAISKQLQLGLNPTLDETFARVPFLRASDGKSKVGNRSYRFVHLTVQEYFAARYFVRQWAASQNLNCLDLQSGKRDLLEPNRFLHDKRYNQRYDIFWRFVVGLLQSEVGTQLDRFFEAIETEPGDLSGPTHQRLIMHCLGEVRPGEEPAFALQTKLEERLTQWILFECNVREKSDLAGEMELPEQVLCRVLQQAPEEARPVLLKSLNKQCVIPPMSTA